MAYVYRWLMTRPVPDLDGRVQLPILDSPVTIRRDAHGVPHIEADTKADLFRAQGFVHAQDRMWQMEQMRRVADGTLAELFGEADGVRNASVGDVDPIVDPVKRTVHS